MIFSKELVAINLQYRNKLAKRRPRSGSCWGWLYDHHQLGWVSHKIVSNIYILLHIQVRFCLRNVPEVILYITHYKSCANNLMFSSLVFWRSSAVMSCPMFGCILASVFTVIRVHSNNILLPFYFIPRIPGNACQHTVSLLRMKWLLNTMKWIYVYNDYIVNILTYCERQHPWSAGEFRFSRHCRILYDNTILSAALTLTW